jgi:hypothetical protein
VPEDAEPPDPPQTPSGLRGDARASRLVGVLALAIAVVALAFVFLRGPSGVRGLAPGSAMPPFAVPLALGEVNGDANVATAAGQGAAGTRPACSVRGPGILNVCQLYEQRPLVLALFVPAGSCPRVVRDLQRAQASFPGVAFAAVAIKGERAPVRRLIAANHLTLPVGLDRDGALASLYQVVTCAQVDFAYPGGLIQSRPLLTRPPPTTLHARIGELVAAAEARGWRRPPGLPAGAG